jgi:hypothetical protein
LQIELRKREVKTSQKLNFLTQTEILQKFLVTRGFHSENTESRLSIRLLERQAYCQPEIRYFRNGKFV